MTSQPLINRISIMYWRLRDTTRRCRTALAYARHRMDSNQANAIIFDCQAAAGWYPLEILSVDGCLQTALDVYWQYHPELESLVQSACARVASKWESTGHARDAAADWALDLIPEYAEARGITLLRHDDDLEPSTPAESDQNQRAPALC
jgi:hypothetical protein